MQHVSMRDTFFLALLEKPKFIQVFLKYNDVYSLVLVTIRILKKCIREKKLAERNDREKESVTQALEYLTLVYEDKNPFALSPSKTFNKVMELLDSILRAVESSI